MKKLTKRNIKKTSGYIMLVQYFSTTVDQDSKVRFLNTYDIEFLLLSASVNDKILFEVTNYFTILRGK